MMFVNLLYAAEEPTQQGGGLIGFLPIIIMFVILYLLIFRPQQKKQKEQKEIVKMAEPVNCKTCGKQVSKTAPTCPHCGENAPGLRIKCPKCSSINISSGQKGFGLGKAAAGAFLLGPVGLLGGMLGRKKVELVCQACGHKWKPDPQDFS